MKALDRKLLRELARLWSQALSIALVVASGLAGFITSLSSVDSLALARERFYAEARFADLFASVKRAPLALAAELQAIEGVAALQTTLEQLVRVSRPGLADPIVGQLISLDPRAPPRLNQVRLASGRWPEPRGDGRLEVLASVGFARAHGLAPGARLEALINGRQRQLVLVGTALSPEFVFAGLWGMPDARGFGVFWLPREALAAAYDMAGAFNRLSVKLAPGASPEAVAAALTRRLGRYGGREVQSRAEQPSHAMLDNEIKEQRVLGSLLPAIFLGVAAFLLNVVVSRLVSTQREQIATLKALGYANARISLHYLQLVLLIVGLGLLLGTLAGKLLGTMLTGLYAEFFHFPSFEHRLDPALLLGGAALTLAAALAGTAGAILATTRLPPAEAMRPPAPGRYRPTLLERWGLRPPAAALRMILRNIERRPLRSGLAVLGVAAAVAIVVLGNFFRDAIEAVVDTQMRLALRGDISLWSVEPLREPPARLALQRLPGVTAVESLRMVPVLLSNGHRRERSLLRGYAPRPELYRVLDAQRESLLLDGRGLVLTDRLAAKLGLRPGDPVQLELLEGRERRLVLPLAGTVSEMIGLNAYLARPELNRLLGDGDLASGFVLAVERGREAEALAASRALPRIAGAWSKATLLRNMEEISARNVRIMSSLLTGFAVVIAVGVVYNSARIALAERAWELASLRVLGFTRAEVSALLLGELALLAALALPLGMTAGLGLVQLIAELLKSDQFHFPVVILPRSYAWAALAVLAAGVASALVVRRRIDRLDLVAVLKTRD